jgi:ABC-type transporter Mla MlaB component
VAGLNSRRRLEGILTLTLVLASLIILPTTVFKTVNAQGVLAGWLYRRAVTIDNTQNSNTLTDYQVLVTVDTASLISAGKMRSDCGDIRFTDEDGVTLLNESLRGCKRATQLSLLISELSNKVIECVNHENP